jgi:hypothetical protein
MEFSDISKVVSENLGVVSFVAGMCIYELSKIDSTQPYKYIAYKLRYSLMDKNGNRD